ncbi:hypothetical protein Tco_0919926 [Tanacetum coccineum]
MDLKDILGKEDKDRDSTTVEDFWFDLEEGELEEAELAEGQGIDRIQTEDVDIDAQIEKPTIEKPEEVSNPYAQLFVEASRMFGLNESTEGRWMIGLNKSMTRFSI